MFTGIVEEVGKIHSIKGEEISIKCKKILEGSKIGDSISVSGVCLTITVINEDSLNFQISEETRAKTTFGIEENQSLVNLERAATFESRIGGHNVEGHVENTGICKSIKKIKDSTIVTFEADSEIINNIIVKGYVSIDGTSLTVNEIDGNLFKVSLIPHTIAETTFKNIKIGQSVNIETDVNARYIRKYVEEIMEKRLNE
ncbi:MAG: riboflavin synthase [SAR202 cluster bacterium]|jgi:riboflavin synthase|nr:MAG: riboflavin synthase [SAR202 cluster bacterium]KAA1298183.1 MAG: riboflavin synthase [SAR202 cluster bacterium]|tara:strand:+ start:280 stop:879 length:600 start_codon:yes stop_codon:yes gene_type:complete